MAKTAISKLDDAIAKILNEYAGRVAENVGEIAADMGRKGAQALKQKSRETVNGSEYAKGWKSKTETSRTGTTAIIYNDHPGLPHLLEYGHVTRNGTGRTFPRTPAHEHIAPVADELAEAFEREVLSKL